MTTFAQTWDRWSVGCVVVTTDPAALAAARAACDRTMDDVERAISGFRADSEVSRLRPGWNDVSPLLADIVSAALRAARESDGAVDPTVGLAVDAWRSGRAPEPPSATWADVTVRGTRLHLPDDLMLDLGAIGKAYAADLAAARAARAADAAGAGVLVGLGGDLASAGGGPVGGWQVLVRDVPADPATTVTLHDGWAVTTSSTEHRRARPDDPGTHHLLDPRTGLPVASPWRSATVVARTAVAANTASTAAVVLGAAAPAWLTAHGLAARLVARDGAVVNLVGFPEDVAA